MLLLVQHCITRTTGRLISAEKVVEMGQKIQAEGRSVVIYMRGARPGGCRSHNLSQKQRRHDNEGILKEVEMKRPDERWCLANGNGRNRKENKICLSLKQLREKRKTNVENTSEVGELSERTKKPSFPPSAVVQLAEHDTAVMGIRPGASASLPLLSLPHHPFYPSSRTLPMESSRFFTSCGFYEDDQ